MQKTNRLFVKVILSALLSLIILLFSFMMVGANQKGMFQVYDEMKVSSPDMDCDYRTEDYKRTIIDFEYPKLIIGEDGAPTVIFIDEKSNKLIFAEINERSSSIINTLPSFGEPRLFWFKWPIIFVNKNIIHMAVIENDYADKRQYRIRIFTLEKNYSVLNLNKEISITKGEIFDELSSKSSYLLSGIYPYGRDSDNYLIHGVFSKAYFNPLGLLSGHLPTFTKNFSVIWRGNEVGQFELIDEKGKFSAENRVYSVSSSGIATAAWIRRWSNISSAHDEALCLSQNNMGTKWTKPFELYMVKNTARLYHLRSLSITNFESSAFLLWQDVEKGFYFAEIKDGHQQEMTQLSDMKPIPFEISKYIEPLSDGANTKITVDSYGNVYALWVLNSAGEYKMFLKARINGKWTETLIVNSGNGTVKLPDVKVDKKNGVVHVAYLKGSINKVTCYYTKLKIKGEKGENSGDATLN